METEIIGDAGIQWTDTPRALTGEEWLEIVELSRLDAIKLHRRLTNSTLKAAIAAVDAIQQS